MCVLTSMLTLSNNAHAEERITLGRTILLENAGHGADIPLLMCRRAEGSPHNSPNPDECVSL
ncbi:DUF2541 family protein [Enterovibrio norvegicus]